MKVPEQESKKLDAFLDAMQEAIIEIGTDAKVVRVNKAGEDIFGLPREKLVGRSVERLSESLSSSDRNDLLSLGAALARKGNASSSGKCSLRRAGGDDLQLVWILSPILFNGMSGERLLILFDLDKTKALESALLHQREDFLAVLNHRLRTPVLATKRINDLLLEGQYGELNERQKEVISLMSENISEVNRLMVMVMDIYQYRSGSKRLRMRKQVLDLLIDPVLNRKTQRDIAITVHLDKSARQKEINCDEKEVLNMLFHLLDNALRYASSKVSLELALRGESELEMTVADDGPGIARDDIKGLFERFYVVSASGRYAPVTGAGLCLCAEIAKAHGGSISCSSTQGQGTSFKVILPVAGADKQDCQ